MKLTKAFFIATAHHRNPCLRAHRSQLRMIFIPPGGFLSLEKLQQLTPPELCLRKIYDECATASRTDFGVDPA